MLKFSNLEKLLKKQKYSNDNSLFLCCHVSKSKKKKNNVIMIRLLIDKDSILCTQSSYDGKTKVLRFQKRNLSAFSSK